MIALLGYGAGPQFVVTFGFYTGAYAGPFRSEAGQAYSPGSEAGQAFTPGSEAGEAA